MPKQNKTVVLIGGGVGSLAGIIFEKKFVENLKSFKNPQISANTVHVNIPSFISDRTEYLLNNNNNNNNKKKNNPAQDMFSLLQPYIDNLKNFFDKIIISIPCNTFQHPKIRETFENLIEHNYSNLNIEFISVLDSVHSLLIKLKSKSDTEKRLAALGTKAVMMLDIYKSAAESANFTYLDTKDFAEDLHDIIYNKEYGLKYTDKASAVVIDKISDILNKLHSTGADFILFACTELSLFLESKEFIASVPKEIRQKILDTNSIYADQVLQSYLKNELS